MRQYYSLVDHLTSILFIIIVGQINDVYANQISMSKNEIRRLRYLCVCVCVCMLSI